MPERSIPEDATIEDVMPTLKNPRAYLTGVLGHMQECKQMHGNASVRIGTTGRGLFPYYRIVFKGETEGETIFGAFYGDNHAAYRTSQTTNKIWSRGTMTYDQVEQLFGKMCGR